MLIVHFHVLLRINERVLRAPSPPLPVYALTATHVRSVPVRVGIRRCHRARRTPSNAHIHIHSDCDMLRLYYKPSIHVLRLGPEISSQRRTRVLCALAPGWDVAGEMRPGTG